MRRASALASASEAALRLPEAFEELYTANPMAAMTTMIRTSKTPFMRFQRTDRKARRSGVESPPPATGGPIALTDYADGTDNAAWRFHQYGWRTARRRIAGRPASRSPVPIWAWSAASSSGDKPVLLNIFPSVDTPVCATSVRTFNERVAGSGVSVLCVSNDLPFAQKRFCGAEDIENVTTASAFRDSFGEDYGVTIADGPMAGLLARAVVVIGGGR